MLDDKIRRFLHDMQQIFVGCFFLADKVGQLYIDSLTSP